MKRLELAPAAVGRVNAACHKEHLAKIAESMRQEGWQGRPLLVEEAFQPGLRLSLYFAWTGSHRLVAAIEACLSVVPCAVFSSDEARQAFSDAGYRYYALDGYSCWRDVATSREGIMDRDRLRALDRAGLAEAAGMLREELEATDGHGA